MTSRTLDEIGIRNGTDKSSLGHGYLSKYARILGPFRDKTFTLLEIGVADGASLRVWEEYFPVARIVGMDLRPECRQHAGGRRLVEIGSQDDAARLTQIAQTYEPSIIIDDGSHQADHVVSTFTTLYPLLQSGGVYIVEDIHFHSGQFAANWRGGSEISPQEFLLRLANRACCPDDAADFDRSLVAMTESVEFFYGGVAIRRKAPPEQEPLGWRRAVVAQANQAALWGLFAMFALNNGGAPEESVAAAQRAIDLRPDDAGHYHQLSIALERSGRPVDALVAARAAVERHPSFPIFRSRVLELEAKLQSRP